MYVCLCNGITDSQVKECALDGCTFKEMINNLNCCKQCNCCPKEVKQIYDMHSAVKNKKKNK